MVGTLCTYRVRQGKEDEVAGMLAQHWPLLHRLGLVTGEPAQILRCRGRDGGVFFVEHFAWKDTAAPRLAEESPEVRSLRRPLAELTDSVERATMQEVPVGPTWQLGPELGALEGAFPWLDGLR